MIFMYDLKISFLLHFYSVLYLTFILPLPA